MIMVQRLFNSEALFNCNLIQYHDFFCELDSQSGIGPLRAKYVSSFRFNVKS